MAIEKSLQEDLKFWRAERPDEWKMDEFIRKAKALEEENGSLCQIIGDMKLENESLGYKINNLEALLEGKI